VTDRADEGVVEFFRRYARTWVHGVATAGLTAFGTLTVVHRGFVVAALAAYLLPPVALYLTRGRRSDAEGATATDEPGRTAPGTDGWTVADPPVEATLFDVVVTDARAYAVGEGGLVLADDETEGWDAVLSDGPGADGRTLRGVDATTDGSAVWVAGDGGALARLDAETGRHVDHSAPLELTDTWVDVAVDGAEGRETVLLVDGSGNVICGQYRGGEVAWTPPRTPGSGSSLSAVDVVGGVGYLCDTNDAVFETTDGGETFRRVGVDRADGTFTGAAVAGAGDCTVSADDGVLHRYDGTRWTPEAREDGPLWAVARRADYGVACGDGVVHEREGQSGAWERTVLATTASLRGASVGAERAVVVGEAGVIVQRRR